MKKKEDVQPGTVLGDMHYSHEQGFWAGLIEGYVLSDLIKWQLRSHYDGEEFLKLMWGQAHGVVNAPHWRDYTNKDLVAFDEGTDGSVKCFWIYDDYVVGVVKLSPKKEDKS